MRIICISLMLFMISNFSSSQTFDLSLDNFDKDSFVYELDFSSIIQTNEIDSFRGIIYELIFTGISEVPINVYKDYNFKEIIDIEDIFEIPYIKEIKAREDSLSQLEFYIDTFIHEMHPLNYINSMIVLFNKNSVSFYELNSIGLIYKRKGEYGILGFVKYSDIERYLDKYGFININHKIINQVKDDIKQGNYKRIRSTSNKDLNPSQ